MAATNFKIVAGNTAPAYQVTCTRSGVPIDLSAASLVEFVIYNKSTKAVTNAGHQSATIVTASSGVVSYSATATDFPSKGTYVADIRITYATTSEILYNQCRWKVRNTGVS